MVFFYLQWQVLVSVSGDINCCRLCFWMVFLYLQWQVLVSVSGDINSS